LEEDQTKSKNPLFRYLTGQISYRNTGAAGTPTFPVPFSPANALDSVFFGKAAGIMTAGRRDRLMGVGDLDSFF
jgi:hypothetical protein